MVIEYADDKWALLETDRAHETKLPPQVINSFRHKLHVIKQAKDERALRTWKSLRYEKLEGNLAGKRSIRINDRYRMIFEIDTEKIPNKITIFSVEDYHR